MRRTRATARFLWWQIRQGFKPVCVTTLRWIKKTLWQHHSRDPKFNQVINRTLQGAMADNKKANAGWLCLWCRVMNGKHANHCHSCGGHWQDVSEGYGSSYRSDSRRQRNQEEDYQQWPKRPKSPRPKGKGKGKGKSPRPKQRRQEQAPLPPSAPAGTPTQEVLAIPSVNAGLSWMQAAQSIQGPPAPAPVDGQMATGTTGAPPQEYKALIDSLK